MNCKVVFIKDKNLVYVPIPEYRKDQFESFDTISPPYNSFLYPDKESNKVYFIQNLEELIDFYVLDYSDFENILFHKSIRLQYRPFFEFAKKEDQKIIFYGRIYIEGFEEYLGIIKITYDTQTQFLLNEMSKSSFEFSLIPHSVRDYFKLYPLSERSSNYYYGGY